MFEAIRNTRLAKSGALVALLALVVSSACALYSAIIFHSSADVANRQHWITASTSVGIAAWVIIAMVVSHIIWKMLVKDGADSVRPWTVFIFVGSVLMALGYLLGERTGPSYEEIVWALACVFFALGAGLFGIRYSVSSEDGVAHPTGGPLFAACGFLLMGAGSVMPLSGYGTGKNTVIHSGIIVGGLFLVLLGVVRFAANNEKFRASSYVSLAVFVFLLSYVAHVVVAILIYGSTITYSSLREGSIWIDGATVLAYVILAVAGLIGLGADKVTAPEDESDDAITAPSPSMPMGANE